jgi:hypothetical protein
MLFIYAGSINICFHMTYLSAHVPVCSIPPNGFKTSEIDIIATEIVQVLYFQNPF